MGTVRGPTDVIVEEYRPVPLWQHVLVGQHLHDLFVDDDQRQVNPELLHRAQDEARQERMQRTGSPAARAIDDPVNAPEAVFARGVTQAEAAAQELVAAVRELPSGPVKARLTRWAIGRYRALGGLREAPKFFAIRYMGVVRQGLLESGQRLVELGDACRRQMTCFT